MTMQNTITDAMRDAIKTAMMKRHAKEHTVRNAMMGPDKHDPW